MTRLFFSNTANSTSLGANIVPSDTNITNSVALTGWPVSTPFKAVIEPDTTAAEVLLVTAVGVGTMTVVRAQDGTTAVSHLAGSTIEHRWSAAEADEANLHVNSNSGVHGVGGSVVGTSDTQTLTAKTLTSPAIDTATVRAGTAAPAAVFKAAASGSADTFQVTDNAGVAISTVRRDGGIVAGTNNPAQVPLTAKAAALQTADLIEVRNAANVVVFEVDSKGRLILKPSDTTSAPIKFVPPTAADVTFLRLRDTTDAADTFVLTTAGEITTAAKLWVAGIASDDPLRYPLDGSKFKVDTNGVVTAVGAVRGAGSVIRLTRTTTDATGATSVGVTEGVSATQPSISLVNGRRYRFYFTALASSSATDLIACRLRIATGTVNNTSTLICEAQKKISVAGGPGQENVFASDEFVATSTGTWHLAAGADTVNGSGNASAFNWYAIVDEVGV